MTKLKPFKKYIVQVKDQCNGQKYNWNLDMRPSNKAWRLQIGQELYGWLCSSRY